MSQEVNNWVDAVANNLEIVGVSTLRDLVQSASTLNVLLERARLPRLHGTTIQEILNEVCLMVQWPEEEPDVED